ncbi:hypothetical protein JCM5353_006955 [Sporobolomyces roseus]
MAPKKQQSKSEGGKKTQISNKGGNKATTASNGDDDCADMPGLEDMRKTDATAGQKGKDEQGAKGAKEGKENVKLPEPRWSQGEASRRVSFPKKDVREAYRLLELETSLSNEKLFWILDKKSNGMLVGNEPVHGSLSALMGAILSIACSRYDVREQSSASFIRIIQRIYIYEANYHLEKLEFPLPRHLPGFDKPLFMETMQDTEKEARESKGELQKMKIELVDYKAEVKEGYKARDEKAAELEKVEGENKSIKSELEKRDEENAKLKEELAKLRASSSTSPSRGVSSDKTSFVIKSLSRQVRDLGRQVKDKNDQLGESLCLVANSSIADNV